MNTKLIVSLVASVSVLSTVALPSHAQTTPTTQPQVQPVSSPIPVTASEITISEMTIPQDTAIIVSFPAAINVDAGQKQEFPVTVPLSSAIKDGQGNVIAPENTPVTIVLKPTKGGVKIIAQSIVVNGRIVAINASSQIIPGTTITHKRANDKAVENGAIWGRIGGSALGFVSGGDPEKFDRGAMGGSLIGLVSGLRSPENTRIVQIPQNSVYVLSLEAPVRISGR
ncbi:hypothetical protein [Calothrix sp. UHCC 0171]|uniref:hypothetical protein n=1 Tax=Calothrix sp. UHCC 0171 TaxID=3110245 RepID=UPI002B21BCC6|nr:hypothetical protein [Calothrix sp. UHCC 0171]MEA5572129.1 hypothetical protein [Calothrix sp. UHCC 0171]